MWLMNILLITLQAVTALLGIGVLGFWIIGRRHVPGSTFSLLNSLAIDLALPCLVLTNILAQFSPQEFPRWWEMPLWWMAFTLVAGALTLALSFLVKKEFRGEFRTGLLYQNAIFFPLLIITGISENPGDQLTRLFLFVFIQPSFVFSTYPLFYKSRPAEESINWRRILNPILVITLIGIVLGLVGIKEQLPEFLVIILALVGAMATPLFMLILGGNVYNDFMQREKGGRRIYTAEVLKFVLAKNVIFPLVFLGLLLALRPTDNMAYMIILQAAVPPITAIPIFAERCGGNRALASQFIVGSFVFAILSIPAVLFLFSRFFSIPSN